MVLPNEVTIYQFLKEEVTQLSKLVEKYKFIWHDKKFAKLSKEN